MLIHVKIYSYVSLDVEYGGLNFNGDQMLYLYYICRRITKLLQPKKRALRKQYPEDVIDENGVSFVSQYFLKGSNGRKL